MTFDEGRRPRVVLVDDHPAVLVAFGRMLSLGCEVVASVSTGHDAIDVVTRLKPDVLVLDLMLPDLDGLEVCRRVKKATPHTCVVIVTAFDDAGVREIAIRHGASAFVPKCWCATVLEAEIHRLVAAKLDAAVARSA